MESNHHPDSFPGHQTWQRMRGMKVDQVQDQEQKQEQDQQQEHEQDQEQDQDQDQNRCQPMEEVEAVALAKRTSWTWVSPQVVAEALEVLVRDGVVVITPQAWALVLALASALAREVATFAVRVLAPRVQMLVMVNLIAA